MRGDETYAQCPGGEVALCWEEDDLSSSRTAEEMEHTHAENTITADKHVWVLGQVLLTGFMTKTFEEGRRCHCPYFINGKLGTD